MQEKKFVKAKPLTDNREKGGGPRDGKKVNAKKYEEKATQPKDSREHIKFMLNAFRPVEQNAVVTELIRQYPNFFTGKPNRPQEEQDQNFNNCLWLGVRRQVLKPVKQMSSDSSDPDWQSDEEKEVKLVSKKIDEKVIQKVEHRLQKKKIVKKDELQRHEKQFLEEHYRQKKQLQQKLQENQSKQQLRERQKQEKVRYVMKEEEENKEKDNDQVQKLKKPLEEVKPAHEIEGDSDWAEYDPKVNELINGGFIQKIEKGSEDDFDVDDDFSMQSQKSSSSSSSDDDMFTNEGPRTVREKKSKKNSSQNASSSNQIVQISDHLFTEIAERAGVHPQTCIWVISNKINRYTLSTSAMNEIYRSQKLYMSCPYISLNHSQFVHNEEIQTDRGVEKLKRANPRKKLRNQPGKNVIANNRNPQPHYIAKK